MSRDAHWTQHMMRSMTDADRDAYVVRSRLMYDQTMKLRAIYAAYKPKIKAIEIQRDVEIAACDQWYENAFNEAGL